MARRLKAISITISIKRIERPSYSIHQVNRFWQATNHLVGGDTFDTLTLFVSLRHDSSALIYELIIVILSIKAGFAKKLPWRLPAWISLLSSTCQSGHFVLS
jgi:hypothetical protein